ncbi:MAG: 30S ribosomal protein S17e [Candidatus Bathyarchaeota archaeon]|nr:30S ribosomal protein S17e [Candidatus Bathyarchaeota archaeon]MDW8040263.1 30S ribosomal protein S17e [Nitrososphaerota archaeon]
MGKVRTEQVKRIAKELIKRFPKKFSGNFEENKHVVALLVPGATPRVRNQIAGYITHFYSGIKPSSSGEDEEKGEQFINASAL